MAKPISAKRLKDAVTAVAPLLPSAAMVRLILGNQGWTPEEIAEHQPAVAKALADRLLAGED